MERIYTSEGVDASRECLHVLVDAGAVWETRDALLAKVHEGLVRGSHHRGGWPQGIVQIERDDLDAAAASDSASRRGGGEG